MYNNLLYELQHVISNHSFGEVTKQNQNHIHLEFPYATNFYKEGPS